MKGNKNGKKSKEQSKHRERDLNRLNDMIYRRWVHFGLKEDVEKIRGRYGVFKEGYTSYGKLESGETNKNENHREQQEDKIGKKDVLFESFETDLRSLMKKHSLPPNSELLLKEYFFSGPLKNPINDADNFTVVDVDLASVDKNKKRSDLMREWDDSGIPYVTVIIPSSAKVKNVQKEMKDLWGMFEKIWEAQGWEKRSERYRPIMDKDITDRALELLSQPKKEKGYKEIEVIKRLEREFPDRKIPSFESLRKMKNRHKKKKEKGDI